MVDKKLKVIFEKMTNPFKKGKSSVSPEDIFDPEPEEEDGEQEDSEFGSMKMMIMGNMAGEDPAMRFDILLNSYNIYNLHTNFWISDKIYKILNYTDGVEMVEVTSPYRARIVFGKAFDDMDVQKTIQHSLTDYLLRDKKKPGPPRPMKLLENIPKPTGDPSF